MSSNCSNAVQSLSFRFYCQLGIIRCLDFLIKFVVGCVRAAPIVVQSVPNKLNQSPDQLVAIFVSIGIVMEPQFSGGESPYEVKFLGINRVWWSGCHGHRHGAVVLAQTNSCL